MNILSHKVSTKRGHGHGLSVMSALVSVASLTTSVFALARGAKFAAVGVVGSAVEGGGVAGDGMAMYAAVQALSGKNIDNTDFVDGKQGELSLVVETTFGAVGMAIAGLGGAKLATWGRKGAGGTGRAYFGTKEETVGIEKNATTYFPGAINPEEIKWDNLRFQPDDPDLLPISFSLKARWRGDKRHPFTDRIFERGFASKGYGGGNQLLRFQERNNGESIYVSTTKDVTVAQDFAALTDGEGWIYEINTLPGGVNITKQKQNRNMALHEKHDKEKEIVYPGGIRPEFIQRATHSVTGEVLENPNYNPGVVLAFYGYAY
jgi:hypothetical protein